MLLATANGLFVYVLNAKALLFLNEFRIAVTSPKNGICFYEKTKTTYALYAVFIDFWIAII